MSREKTQSPGDYSLRLLLACQKLGLKFGEEKNLSFTGTFDPFDGDSCLLKKQKGRSFEAKLMLKASFFDNNPSSYLKWPHLP